MQRYSIEHISDELDSTKLSKRGPEDGRIQSCSVRDGSAAILRDYYCDGGQGEAGSWVRLLRFVSRRPILTYRQQYSVDEREYLCTGRPSWPGGSQHRQRGMRKLIPTRKVSLAVEKSVRWCSLVGSTGDGGLYFKSKVSSGAR